MLDKPKTTPAEMIEAITFMKQWVILNIKGLPGSDNEKLTVFLKRLEAAVDFIEVHSKG